MLRMFLNRANAIGVELLNNPTQDLVEATARLALLQETIKQLQVVEREAKNQVIALTDTGQHVVAVRGRSVVLQRTETIERKNWRHLDVCTRLIEVARDRGQIAGPHDVAPLIVEMASITYWKGDKRTGSGLFRLGIDRDDYCDVTRDGKVQLQGTV